MPIYMKDLHIGTNTEIPIPDAQGNPHTISLSLMLGAI